MSIYVKKVALNAFSNWGALLIGLVITFVMSPIIINSLGDTKYGIWAIMTSISGYLTLLDLGIGSAVTRYVSKSTKTGDKRFITQIFNTALALYIIIGVIIICISPALAWVTEHLIKQQSVPGATIWHLVILIAVDVSLFLVGAAYRGYYQGVQRYDMVNSIAIFLSILKAFAFYFLLKNGYGLVAMAYVIIAGDLLALFGYAWMVRYTNNVLSYDVKSIHKEDIKTLITYSKFTFINMIANQFIYYSDSFVIGAFISAAAIAYYSIGWSLVEYLKKICLSFSRVFVPVFSELEASSDSDNMRKIMVSGSKMTLFLSLPFCFSLLVVGQQFITLWIGGNYGEKAYIIMAILLVPQFFEIPQQVNCSLLFGIGKHRFLSYANTVAGIINLVMSLLLVTKYGATGVAIGTAIPQILLNAIILPIYVCGKVDMKVAEFYKKVYGKAIVPGGIFFIILYLLSVGRSGASYFSIVGNVVMTSVVYLLAIYLAGLKKEEKLFVNSVLNRVWRKVWRKVGWSAA